MHNTHMHVLPVRTRKLSWFVSGQKSRAEIAPNGQQQQQLTMAVSSACVYYVCVSVQTWSIQ